MKRIIAVASVVFILAAFVGCSRKTTDDLNSAVSDVKSDVESAMSGDGTGSENVSSMSDGKYTVPSVSEELVITVEGVVKKEVLTITKPIGEGFTFSGADTVYKNEDYTFTISVDNAF